MMYLVPNLSSYTHQERSACWLDGSDYERIQKESHIAQKSMLGAARWSSSNKKERLEQQEQKREPTFVCRHHLHQCSCTCEKKTSVVTVTTETKRSQSERVVTITSSSSTTTSHDGDDDNDHRGLETHLDPKRAYRRIKDRTTAANLVFDEQEDQWEDQVVDEESIRHCYRRITQRCADDAYRVGLNDALQAGY